MYFQGVRIDNFARQYKVYSGAFSNKSNLDDGGKIILPSSALDELSRLNIVWPIMFKISNNQKGVHTHCGVLEFSAEEGRVYVPFWMMEHLQLNPGQIVTIQNATLPKGSFVKLRPQQKAFIEISDPKAVLEQKLRNFSCLTKGDTIMIKHLNQNYCIDILEVGAKNKKEITAISIVETDVEVEFDRPLDMPKSPEPVPMDKLAESQNFETPLSTSPSGAGILTKKRVYGKKKEEETKPKEEEKPSFAAFQGSGRRLDGKGTKLGSSPPIANTNYMQQASSSSTNNSSSATSSNSSTAKPSTETSKDSKFIPFGGQGRSLK